MATIMRKLNIINRCEAVYRTQQSKEHLPGVYHSYVLAICKQPGLSQDRIAKHLYINKSNVTRHLAYLETNGYIQREISKEDKRELLVYPTQKMLDIHPDVVSIKRKWNSLVFEGISEQELELFNNIVDKMLNKSIETAYSEGAAQ